VSTHSGSCSFLCTSVLFAFALGGHLGLIVVMLWLLGHVGWLWPVSSSVSDVTPLGSKSPVPNLIWCGLGSYPVSAQNATSLQQRLHRMGCHLEGKLSPSKEGHHMLHVEA
jgi:hypothetical protein